jgi:hypothetical protein
MNHIQMLHDADEHFAHDIQILNDENLNQISYKTKKKQL